MLVSLSMNQDQSPPPKKYLFKKKQGRCKIDGMSEQTIKASEEASRIKQIQPEYRSQCGRLVFSLLEKLDKYHAKSTFFVTGTTHKYFPELVERIHESGHEIGYHAFNHVRLKSPESLEAELALSRDFLNAYQPSGFRAPWIYLEEEMLPLLKGAGFSYDSSTVAPPGKTYMCEGLRVFPISCLFYFQGEMADPLYPHQPRISRIYRELPFGIGMMVSILRGLYSRILGHYSRKNTSIIFYLHLQQLQWLDGRLGLRDGMWYIHKFSLWPLLDRLLSRHRFCRLDSLLVEADSNQTKGIPHFLTFDMEF